MKEVSRNTPQGGDYFAALCCEGLMKDLPDSFNDSDGFAASATSLDVHAYLQRDADAIFGSTFLSLRSDIARDPQSPGYDMATPPANHREAMMRRMRRIGRGWRRRS